MKINIKKLDKNAIIPQPATDGSGAMDVTAVSMNVTDKYIEYDTGLAFEVPKGYVMLIFPRSSVSKYDLTLANSVGILDSDYRGPLKLRFKRNYRIENKPSEVTDNEFTTTSILWGENVEDYRINACDWYNVGDKVGQIMIIPSLSIEFNEVNELSNTERGTGGFGSTGA